MQRKIIGFCTLLFLAACTNPDNTTPTSSTANAAEINNAPATINYSVIGAYPHDTTSFTEGFLVHDGVLYESTGHAPDLPSSRSLFGPVDLKTGRIQVKSEIGNKYFGEGIAFLHGKIYELTLDSKIGFIYDEKSFKKIGEFTFPSKEGWGMTTNGTNLIMSDGSSNISYLDPNSFKLVKILGVSNNNGPVGNLNELELINGYLYANEWQTNNILKIDTASGKVVGKLDLSSLANEALNKYPDSKEMNGIAYDSVSKKIYVTGKMWPNIYQIQFTN